MSVSMDSACVGVVRTQSPIRLARIAAVIALSFVLAACGGSGSSATSTSSSSTQATPEAATAAPPEAQPTATLTAVPPTETPANTAGLPEDALAALNKRLDPAGQEYTIAAAVKLPSDLELTFNLNFGLGSINETQVIPGASGDAYCVMTSPPITTKLLVEEISLALDQLAKIDSAYTGYETFTESRYLITRRTPTGAWQVKPSSYVDYFVSETVRGWNQLCGFAEGQEGYLPLPTALPTATPVEGATGRMVYFSRKGFKLSTVTFSNPTPVTLLPDEYVNRVSNPVISPDGLQVAFVYRGANANFAQTQIAVVPVTGASAPTFISKYEGQINGLAWSPDSKQIAFTSGVPDKTASLYTISIDDPASETLIAEYEYTDFTQLSDVAWLADGKTILTVAHISDFTQSPGKCSHTCLYSFDLTTKQEKLFSPLSDVKMEKPVLSRDGKKLAFLTGRGVNGQRGYTISVFDFDSGKVSKFGDLELDAATTSMIAWSPEGDALAVVLGGGSSNTPPYLYMVKPGAATEEDAIKLFDIEVSSSFSWGIDAK